MKKSLGKVSVATAAVRRQAERLAIEVPISIRVPGRSGRFKEQTRTLDISRGGASFSAQHFYRPGMKVRLGFLETRNLLGGMREIPAHVVHVSKSAVAVRFNDAGLAGLILAELLRVKMRTSSALLGIVQALSSGAEVGVVIERICRTTERAMEVEKALLFLLDRQQSVLRARTQVAGAQEFCVGLGEGLVGTTAAAGQLTSVQTLAEDPRFRPKLEKYFDEHTRSVLCVPLSKENGASPGLLVILNKRYGSFTQEDEDLGVAVANQISGVLREARLFENIRNMKNYNERILESIATGVLTFDKFGKLTTINRAGTEIFGFQPQAEVGKDFATLFAGSTNARLRSLTEDVLAKQRRPTGYDVQFLRRDGARFSLNLSALPLEDVQGNFLGGLLVAENITQEQRLMNTLTRYMSRELAEQVVQHKDKLELGGTRADVTILLTDIRNFTTISEQMDPGDIVDLLNAYLPRMINVIFRHQGMVDKFIGDAILAVFGVPVSREDDSLRAVRAAIEMRAELHSINSERACKQMMTIEIGIGITSGTVISGNIGSDRRMDYTVIGDPVNLAARLEGLTKEVGRKILVNEGVRDAVDKEIPCEALGMFKVKGKQEEVPIFAIRSVH